MNSPILAPPASPLADPFGRRITYLRLSVTDRCDFRCVYCMAEDMVFLPRSEVLSLEEIACTVQAFVALGVRKVRLTGGEPLVRRGILDLARTLGGLPGLEQLVLTTNGSRLAGCAQSLRAAGVRRVNISLDSLRPERFRALTRHGDLHRVLRGIDAALEAGFERVKINSVILPGRNDDEVLELVDFARGRGADISFIEEMPLGDISEHDRARYCSSDELLLRIGERWPLLPTLETTGGPSRYYRMGDSASRVGFISPHSRNFCADCNRVRLTANGQLLPCLGHEQATDLRAVLRRWPGDQVRLQEAIRGAIAIKPERHYFDPQKSEVQVVRFMNMTGG